MNTVVKNTWSALADFFHHRFVSACLAGVLLSACGQPADSEKIAESDSPAIYTSGPASAAGTGRFYMHREIAQVMSYRGADWLERNEREELERTDLVLSNLALDPASIVADIGAGSGYFSRRIARLVPDGKVIAVDIQPEMLAILEAQAAEENIDNIKTVLAQEKSPNLAPASIDLALLVDVYHELKWPREVMLDIKEALRPGGRVVLIEYRAEDPSVQITPIHKMSETQARKELEAVGMVLAENQNFLPRQHFLVFTVAEPANSSDLTTRAWDCANNGYVVTNPADNGKGLWIFLPGETLRLDADTAQPEYQFRKDAIAFGYAGQRAELSVAGVPDRCTENRRASIQEDAKLRGMDFWATGNEPPWKLEIGPEKILLNTGYDSTITEFPPTVPVSDDSVGKATYLTQGKGGLLEIEISGGACSDSMSGESFASSVTIRLGTDTSTEQATTILRGCGRALH